jgi:hypothetical protein
MIFAFSIKFCIGKHICMLKNMQLCYSYDFANYAIYIYK